MNIYTCFQKRKSQLITFKLGGEAEAMIDFTLVNNKCRSSVKDLKVTPSQEIGSHHCLLSMDMVFKHNTICQNISSKQYIIHFLIHP